MKGPQWVDGYRELVLHSAHAGETFRVIPYTAPDGVLDPDVRERIGSLLRDARTDEEVEINERLILLLYNLSVKLRARRLVVVSGYRSDARSAESRHAKGQAVDMVVSGVPLRRAARVARSLGRVGVGLYPRSGFIHLDVRDRSYFWVDRSGPGARSCRRRILPGLGRRFDRRYRPSKERPITGPPKAHRRKRGKRGKGGRKKAP